jgi:hypothetical protein
MRTLLHSVVLALGNLLSCWIGFVAHSFFRPLDQVMVQAPVTGVLSVALFTGWLAVSRRFMPRVSQLQSTRDGFWTYMLAFMWAAVLFVPLHFLFTGYLTGAGNIVALWGLQLPINAAAIVVGMKMVHPGGFGTASPSTEGHA